MSAIVTRFVSATLLLLGAVGQEEAAAVTTARPTTIDPATVDPTYGLEAALAASDSGQWQRLEIPVKQIVKVEPRRGKVSGAETLVGSLQPANLVVQPPPAGTVEADSPAVMVDFGRELAGWVEVVNASSGPIEITLRYGESEGEAIYGPHYITGDSGQPGPLEGIQKRTIPAGAVAKGVDRSFRYAIITVLSGPESGAVISHIRAILSYYPVVYRGSFDCSDPLLTKLWYTGAYTTHLCIQDGRIMDSPMYRGPWGGDLLVEGVTINTAFLDRLVIPRTLDELRVNADDPQTHQNGYISDIPGYSCAWVVLMAHYLKHTGDIDYVKRHHDDLIRLIDKFRGDLDEHGLFANKQGGWDFVDWMDKFSAAGPANVQSTRHSLGATHFFMVQMLEDGAWLLQQMGDKPKADEYRQWAAKAIQAAQKALFDPSTKTVQGNLWQDNVMAVYSDTANPTQRKAIWEKVLSPRGGGADPFYPKSQQATPYFNYYAIFAMSKAGHTEGALRFMRWYWGSMPEKGLTTFPETYDPRQPVPVNENWRGYSSRCHGWSSGPTSFLTECVLGIRPTGIGFETVEIQPELAGLSWAKGVAPTPHGDITVDYKSAGNRLVVDIDVPAGVRATILLPDGTRYACEGGHFHKECASGH